MSSPPPRASQRLVLACTACTRRKVRCSKTIPCTACIRQDKAASCQREPVTVQKRPLRRSRAQSCSPTGKRQRPPETRSSYAASSSSSVPGQALSAVQVDNSAVRTGHAADTSPSTDTRITDDAATALEFLAHGRRNVLQRFVTSEVSAANHSSNTPKSASGDGNHPWDTYLATEEARFLLLFHQNRLAWMHKVVHLPQFMREFEENLILNECDDGWLALYYALLSQTLYHIDGEYFESLPRLTAVHLDLSHVLFNKSLEILFKIGFMDRHSFIHVQVICILMQVALNFDKSDLICVLISTAIRISQCLNLHRLGPDKLAGPLSDQSAIDREMQKRVWWFLVRYDWLQIPFQNICQIHPAQFNTPMPTNCYDDDRMVKNGRIVPQPDSLCTSSIWTNGLNSLSVLLWRHQDRTLKGGYLGDEEDNVSKLYDQVIWADDEIKRLYASWSPYLQGGDSRTEEDHNPSPLMPGIMLVCTAHKILAVHRHFQLSGFRDRRFAFSQLSCVTIAERSMRTIQQWPDTLESRIVRRMWTTLTHVVSCSITLMLALLFKSHNSLTHNVDEIRQQIDFGRRFISYEERSSSIARRGCRILEALSSLEDSAQDSENIEVEIENVMRRVVAAEDHYAANVDSTQSNDGPDDFDQGSSQQFSSLNPAETDQIVIPNGNDFWDSLLSETFYGTEDFTNI